jgi:thiol-disulfide isomerase/thioredoxin
MTLRALIGAWFLALSTSCAPSGTTSAPATRSTGEAGVRPSVKADLPALEATEWLNSKPLTTASLRGKIVLVQFWTYSCVNWRRTLPYLRVWSERYRSHGLVVIGVHSPEFEFEKDGANVRRAVHELEIAFPVAVDSRWTIWKAFDNRYWPALYLFDTQGRLRHHLFGEVEYERTEAVLQQLLLDAGADGVGREVSPVAGRGPELAADWSNLRSPETYLGSERAENFASPGAGGEGLLRGYTAPLRMPLNEWALSGAWTVQRESVLSHQSLARVALRFHARDLHLVIGPAVPGTSVRFRVRLDGRPPAAAHGEDADEQGNGTLNAPRMYHLLRQPRPILDRDFEIEFLDPGARAFAFTFG